MIERTQHDDVTALRLSWWRSRSANFSVYVYMVRGALVDSGFAGASTDIAALVRDARPRGVFVTHQHEDHSGNIEMLAALGVPIGVSADTERIVRAPYPIGLYRRWVWRGLPTLRSRIDPFSDDTLSLEHAPGHSADHHIVWDHTTNTLFAGDLFLGVKVRVAHSDEDPRAQVASIRALLARKPSRVFCMHRGLIPNGADALAAKANWMDEIMGRIELLHTQGRSLDEIRIEVLGPLTRTHYVSRGEYSPENIVRTVIGTATPAANHANFANDTSRESPRD